MNFVFKSPPIRKAFKIIGFILLAFLILGAGVFALSYGATRGVSAGADTFFETLKNGEVEAAYALTSSGFKEAVTPEQFKEFIGIYDLQTITSTAWTSWGVKLGGTGNVGGSITRQDETVWDTEVKLKKEEGVWKVHRFDIDLREETMAQ